MTKFFAETATRRWVKFFLWAQIVILALFIVALFVANEYVDKHGYINAYFLFYSPLNIALSLLSGPAYFPPLLGLFWISPLLLIYPYSLLAGGLLASIQKCLKRPNPDVPSEPDAPLENAFSTLH